MVLFKHDLCNNNRSIKLWYDMLALLMLCNHLVSLISYQHVGYFRSVTSEQYTILCHYAAAMVLPDPEFDIINQVIHVFIFYP